jgi:hypothetical protein
MSSLLDDVNQLLNQNKGDSGRLQYIKDTLEKNKTLYISDRKYLTDLSKKYLENKIKKTTQIKTNLNYSEKSDDMLYSENENIVGNDESKISIQKESESKIFCTSCGNQMLDSAQFCTNCGTSPNVTIRSNPSNYAQYSKPTPSVSGVWYLLPILFGLIGGIIAWVIIRKKDSKKAKNCLIVGIVMIAIGILVNLLMGSTSTDISLLEYVSMIFSCEFMYGFFNELGQGKIIDKICFNNTMLSI